MDDVLQAFFRWIHLLAGITWIGLLYYFNLINAHFQGSLEADVRKQVVPQLMPRTLWWFRAPRENYRPYLPHGQGSAIPKHAVQLEEEETG